MAGQNDIPASVRAVPGDPGVYVNEATGEVFKLVEFHDDDRYDTEDVPSSVTVGTTLDYFQTLGDKNDIDINVDTQHKLASDETMVIKRVWVDLPLARGQTITTIQDIKRVAYAGYLEIKLNKFIIAQGPLFKFGSGYGLAGMTNENNQGIVTIGVPSTAAKRDLDKHHFVNDKISVFAKVIFQDRAWDTGITAALTLAAKMHLRVGVGGLVGAAATK